MSNNSLRAFELRQQGKSFAEIGRELGVTRQTAQYHVNRGLASFAAKQPTPREMQAEVFGPAAPLGPDVPMTVGARLAVDDATMGGWTPSRLSAAIQSALSLGNTKQLFQLFREIERKDANFRSVMETRINQVAALPIRVTPGGQLARDRKVAEWVQSQLEGVAFQDAIPALLMAPFDGVSVCEVVLEVRGDRWVLGKLPHIDPKDLLFSKKDGRTLYIAPATQGGAPEPLEHPKVLVHYAKRNGLVVGSGLTLAAAWAYTLKWLAKRDWASLSSVYGKPVKLGKYKAGVNPEEIRKLRAAVAQLGSEAAAVIDNTMSVEFLKDATASGSADMFERLVRYLDEQVAKLVLGASLTTGTSNTGSGGSQALGNVHNELRFDIMASDAKALSRSVQALVETLVAYNFGPDTPMPKVEFVVEEAEDVQALASVAEKGQKLGLPLSKKGLAARLNLPLADEDDPDDLLQPLDGQAAAGAAEEAPTKGTKSGFSQAQASFAANTPDRDALDDLVDLAAEDWEQLTSGIDAALTEVARSSTDLDDLRAKLASFASGDVDVKQLQNYLTQLRTNARLAGDSGAEV